MSRYLARWARLAYALGGAILVSMSPAAGPAAAATTSCLLKATEPVDVTLLLEGKEYWQGKIPKGEQRTVTLPEGPFTVVSSVYNQNLKTTEDIRTEAHTRMCNQQSALSVPLFAQR